MNLNFEKAKLGKSKSVEAQYTDVEGNSITYSGCNPCHPDLMAALDNLVPFFADITEQKEADDINFNDIYCDSNRDLLKSLNVTGVRLVYDDCANSAMLIGKRLLRNGKVLNINSPLVELGAESDYEFAAELDVAVKQFLFEVEQYVSNKKYAAVQGELNFAPDGDDPFASPGITADVAPIAEGPAA
ncbi:MAG: hypothetical protein ACI4UN_03060 [Muribaculaceae bacterium]